MHYAELNIMIRNTILKCSLNRCVNSLPVVRMNEICKIVDAATEFTALHSMDVVDQVRPFDMIFRYIPVPNSDSARI